MTTTGNEGCLFSAGPRPRDRFTPAVLAVLREIDAGTERLSEASGLRCPPTCGACCLSPEVTASVLECLPLADHLLASGRAQHFMARFDADPTHRPCFLYQADPGDPERGRCGEYEHRPSLCRLFGFSARRRKDGSAELIACVRHKSAIPEAVQQAQAVANREEGVAFAGDSSLALAAIDPSLAQPLLPINEAVAKAIERLALRHSLSSPRPGSASE